MGEQLKSAERIFDLIEILAKERVAVSLTELSAKAGLSKTTVHRMLQTLVTREYAVKDRSSKYTLGPKLIELASYHIENLELQSAARPFLADLYSELKLTVHLGKVVADKVIYLELMDRAQLHKSDNSGIGVPAYTSSIGKCILALMSGRDLDELLYRSPLKKYTANTITDPVQYKAHLKQVRANGWAIDNEEYLAGRRCVGAPVFDFTGTPIASVSVSGDTDEISDSRLSAIVDAVTSTAEAISRNMGYVP